MNADKTVRIGGACGFWGDSAVGARQLVASGQVDYLAFDYLSEVTMSILTRARMKDPTLGYATDFPAIVIRELAPQIAASGVRLLANAGGINPRACAEAIRRAAAEAGVELSVAVVEGDDLMPRIEALRDTGVREMFSGAALPKRVVSANAYLGAFPIAQALATGAQVVVTGRCVDSALVLAPLIHEFDWGAHDFDRLAGGSLAGHLLECGAQATGGLHTDWEHVPDWPNIGYPIAECSADGSFVVTKTAGTGGLVTPATVGEQMLYEVGDPARYLLPDVACDFTHVTMHADGEHRVRVRGARGHPPPPTLKVSATYADGFRITGQLTIIGIDAARKARRTADALLARVGAELQRRGLPPLAASNVEVVGAEHVYGEHARTRDAREVVLRVTATHPSKEALELFAREVAPAGTSWSPGTTGAAGRPSPTPHVKLFSFKVPRGEVAVTVASAAGDAPHRPAEAAAGTAAASAAYEHAAVEAGPRVTLPLVKLAWARSGDKGDTANIGVIARHPDLVEVLAEQLPAQRVRGYFAHLVAGDATRYEVPGIHAFNFVLNQALGGGGMASLRHDPLGKGLANMLLDIPIDVPEALLRRLGLNGE